MFYIIQTIEKRPDDDADVVVTRELAAGEYETKDAACTAAMKFAKYAPGTFTIVEPVADVTQQAVMTDLAIKR